MFNTKTDNEQKCLLVIFVSSVSRHFGPSSVEFKYIRIVARFTYAKK